MRTHFRVFEDLKLLFSQNAEKPLKSTFCDISVQVVYHMRTVLSVSRDLLVCRFVPKIITLSLRNQKSANCLFWGSTMQMAFYSPLAASATS